MVNLNNKQQIWLDQFYEKYQHDQSDIEKEISRLNAKFTSNEMQILSLGQKIDFLKDFEDQTK